MSGDQLNMRWLADWTARLRTMPGPPVVAVLLRGSYARAEATRFSDVDFDLLVSGGPYRAYPAWLEPYAGRLVHVSVAICDAVTFLNRLEEPAGWAFGWPAASPARALWVDEAWRGHLDREELTHPAGNPELEDLIGDLGKVYSAYTAGDELGARSAAADLARLVPTVLRLVNEPVTVAHRRDALETVLNLPVAPEGYRDDMLACFGYVHRPVDQVAAAARRLVEGTVPLLRPVVMQLREHCGEDLAKAVSDGRLEQYVAQLTTTA